MKTALPCCEQSCRAYIRTKRWFWRRCSRDGHFSLLFVVIRHEFCRSSLSFWKCGSQMAPLYSMVGRTREKYAVCFACFGQYFRLRLRKFRVLLAFLAVTSTWFPHSRLLLIVMSRYFACSTSKVIHRISHKASIINGDVDRHIFMVLHLVGLKRILPNVAHLVKFHAFYKLVRCAAHLAKCANWSNAPYMLHTSLKPCAI